MFDVAHLVVQVPGYLGQPAVLGRVFADSQSHEHVLPLLGQRLLFVEQLHSSSSVVPSDEVHRDGGLLVVQEGGEVQVVQGECGVPLNVLDEDQHNDVVLLHTVAVEAVGDDHDMVFVSHPGGHVCSWGYSPNGPNHGQSERIR